MEMVKFLAANPQRLNLASCCNGPNKKMWQACIAGLAVRMKDPKLFDSLLALPWPSNAVVIDAEARKILKLTPDQGHRLFWISAWPTTNTSILKATEGEEEDDRRVSYWDMDNPKEIAQLVNNRILAFIVEETPLKKRQKLKAKK